MMSAALATVSLIGPRAPTPPPAPPLPVALPAEPLPAVMATLPVLAPTVSVTFEMPPPFAPPPLLDPLPCLPPVPAVTVKSPNCDGSFAVTKLIAPPAPGAVAGRGRRGNWVRRGLPRRRRRDVDFPRERPP